MMLLADDSSLFGDQPDVERNRRGRRNATCSAANASPANSSSKPKMTAAPGCDFGDHQFGAAPIPGQRLLARYRLGGGHARQRWRRGDQRPGQRRCQPVAGRHSPCAIRCPPRAAPTRRASRPSASTPRKPSVPRNVPSPATTTPAPPSATPTCNARLPACAGLVAGTPSS
jgi:hypothetical protein